MMHPMLTMQSWSSHRRALSTAALQAGAALHTARRSGTVMVKKARMEERKMTAWLM